MGIQELPPQSCYHLREADPSIPLLDVRTPEEFAAGHPEGALNLPSFLLGADGSRQPNPAFLEVAQRVLSDKTGRVIVSCASGRRSLRACQALQQLGYSATINLIGGFDGAREPSGALVSPGWCDAGLPVSTEAGDRGWEHQQAEFGS